ncbi:TPA: ABC transporter permease [Staphylococcus aureus]|nr:ABC transporter permease [Staphylococcus aureus]HCY8317075.1 ABC transporter permease [Staphylococcus aureus]HDA5574202.1 ABC transporter permease [Staphylococcus aureus]HDB4974352.1 ABC transporter permease [Staphylococcus aureus]HDG8686228.1 ABC transporter permease [Staphylococcus aureus]
MKDKTKGFLWFLAVLMVASVCLVGANEAFAKEKDPISGMFPSNQDDDLPKVESNIVGYKDHDLDNYSMDYVLEEKDDKPWYDVIGLSEKAYNFIENSKYEILNGIWSTYKIFASVFIFLVSEAFEFTVLGSIVSELAGVISTIGGSSGIGKFITWAFIGVVVWLIATISKGELRKGTTGVFLAIVFTALFSIYVTNAKPIIQGTSDLSQYVSNTILNTSTSVTGENQSHQTESSEEDISNKKGLATMKNTLHEILIVKPWLQLEFGTTNVNEIGGGKAGEDNKVEDGKRLINGILDHKPKSDKRNDIIKDHKKNMSVSNNYTTSRIVVAVFVFIPSFIIGISAILFAVAKQFYELGFVVGSVILVGVLIIAIIPSFVGYLKGTAKRTGGHLLMSIVYVFLLVLMFTLINITYQISEEKNWNYIVTAISLSLICLGMLFMQGRLIKNDYQKVMSSIKQQNISEQRANARKKREKNKNNNNGNGNQPVYVGVYLNVKKKPTEHISMKKANDHNTITNGGSKKDGGTISKKPKVSEQEQGGKPPVNRKESRTIKKKPRAVPNKNESSSNKQSIQGSGFKERLNKTEDGNDSSRVNEQIQTNKPKTKPVIRKKPMPVTEYQEESASRETENRIDAIKRNKK